MKSGRVLYFEDMLPEKYITEEGKRLKRGFSGNIKSVSDWLDKRSFYTIYDLPKVQDQYLFVECVKTLINLSYDIKNGYMIEFNSDYTKLRKLIYSYE